MTILELRDVSKSYDEGVTDVRAFESFGPAVPGCQLLARSPSGSGKTTLFANAGSLGEPTAGEGRDCDVSLANLSRSDKARLRRRTLAEE